MTYTPKTQTIYSNYRIQVALQDRWLYNQKTHEENHTSMTRELEKFRIVATHSIECDNGISSHFDREVYCQFCGTPWEEAIDDDGVPWCCSKAQSDYEAQTGRTIQ